MKFKIGDIVTPNPEFDKVMKGSCWWENWKNKPMTIVSVGRIISVKENNSCWVEKWLIKSENDFFSEEEFKI